MKVVPASLNSTDTANEVNVGDVRVSGNSTSQLVGNSGRFVTQGFSDRKFNLVFFGIPESLAGTAYRIMLHFYSCVTR